MQEPPVRESGRAEATEGTEQLASEPAAEGAATADAAGPVPMVTDTQLEPSSGEAGPQDWASAYYLASTSSLPARAIFCESVCYDRRHRDVAGCMAPHGCALIQ